MSSVENLQLSGEKLQDSTFATALTDGARTYHLVNSDNIAYLHAAKII